MKAPPRPEGAAPTARRVAHRILRRVETGDAYASVLLDHARGTLDDPREAGLARELVLGVLRRRAVLDHVLRGLLDRPLGGLDPGVRAALRLGLYEVVYLDRVPGFASVDRAVDLVKRGPRGRGAAGLVNAVLRRATREARDRLPAPPAGGDVRELALFHSHPEWWVARLVDGLGEERASRLLAADNEPAPTTLAVNRARTEPERLSATLREQGVATEPGRFLPDALRVTEGAVPATRAFADGLCWIQDEASQLVPALLGGRSGARVADLCAAPGGKTLGLLSRLPPDGKVIACDRHRGRLARLRENLARVDPSAAVELRVADLTRPEQVPDETFDDVLLDAPCTGTGTLRRHPEIRWRLRPRDIRRMAALQARLLDVAASRVARGGRLVYSVCSLEPEEGPDAVAAFVGRHPGFERVDPRPGLPPPAHELIGEDLALRTAPDRGGLDGFYAALLVRS